jgi:hypothetical protein
MKSGNLNFLEPSGPFQACNGTALPLIRKTSLNNGSCLAVYWSTETNKLYVYQLVWAAFNSPFFCYGLLSSTVLSLVSLFVSVFVSSPYHYACRLVYIGIWCFHQHGTGTQNTVRMEYWLVSEKLNFNDSHHIIPYHVVDTFPIKTI